MPPSEAGLNIYHTYQRCSLGTAAVVQWLCMNAENCGHQLSPPKPTSKSGNKRAKVKAKAKANQNPESKEIPVAVAEYLTLAKVIAASTEPQIQAPAWVFHLLSDMISVRKICIEIYASSVKGNDDTSDITENPSSQKISILEEVLRVLESRKCDQSSPTQAFSEAYTLREDLLSKNPYDRLFPDEPIKAVKNWQRCSLSAKPLFVPSLDREEEVLRFQCFLEDSYGTRRFIRKSWEAYRRKETDLYAVSVITNTAIQYLQGILLDITDSKPGEPMDIDRYLALAAESMNLSADILKPFCQQGDLPIDETIWEKAEKIYLPAYSILKQFNKDVAIGYRSSPLSHDEPLETRKDGPAAAYNRSKNILTHFLGEIACLFTSGPTLRARIPCKDSLTSGLFEMFENEMPSWIPLACTIYVDIYEVLDTDLKAGTHDLLLSCQRIGETLHKFIKSPRILEVVPAHIPKPKKASKSEEEQQRRLYQVELTTSENEEVPIDEHVCKVLDLLRSVLWVQSDSIRPARRITLKLMGFKNVPKAKPYHLFNIHPLLCGTIDFHFALRMQDASIQAINDWGVVLSTVYLYSTLLNEVPNEDSKRWRDIEMLSGMQFEEIGGLPKNASEVLEQFEKNIGFTAKDFGQSLPPCPIASNLFKPKSEIFNLLFGSYCNSEQLNLAKFKTEWKWTQKAFLTPERLCLELALCLRFEFFALKFNYLNLHMRCARLLHRIHWNLDDEFAARFAEGYIDSRKQLPFLVGYLLTDLCMHASCKTMRNDEQRLFRRQYGREPDVKNSSHLETGDGESETEVDAFEDYASRDPRCSIIVPALLYQAGELMDNFICAEGDWEHRALEAIKDPRKAKPTLQEPPLSITMEEIKRDVYEGWLQQ